VAAEDQLKQIASVPKILTKETSGREIPDKRAHVSIVDIRHVLQLSNIPRSIWEEVTAILNEALYYRHFCLTTQEIEAGACWLDYPANWVSGLFTTSQSVGGHQGELMVRGMGADKAWEPKSPAASIGGNGDTGKPESKKRGWLGGDRN